MRLRGLLVALNLATISVGKAVTGGAVWDRLSSIVAQKSAAGGSRRVFGSQGRHSHCCSVLAFGRSPSPRATVKGSGSVEPAADALQDLTAPEMEKMGVSAGVGGGGGGAGADGAAGVDAGSSKPGFAQTVVTTVRDFLVDARRGTTALWTNFQVSQDIRKRVKGGHELTYAEHAHLERGANDRRKLLQFVIIYAISPETFPYVVLYVPSLLPSTFEKPHAVRAKYDRLAHERVSATLMGLSQLEKQVLDANAKFKGKARQAGTRQTKRVEALEIQRDETLKILESGSKRKVFERLQEYMVAPAAASEDTKSKKKQKLPSAGSGVPNVAIKALGKGMGLAGWRGIAPGFYVQYRLNEHMKELGKGDDILRRVPLDSLSDSDLQDACDARAIDVDGGLGDAQALRNSLAEWLELTSADVAARSVGPGTVFLPERARLLGLALNFLENTREGKRSELERKALLSTWCS